MNFVVLYCNKNQYEMFEEFIFKHSPADFNKVTICVYDDNSDDDQKDKLRKLCKKYENIKWINPNVNSDSIAPFLSCNFSCDEYLTKNNIDADWMLFFENDVFPFQDNFWELVEEKINFIKTLNADVGSFGFSSYQDFDKGVVKSSGSPTIGRGCLLDGILEHPHGGWYKDLPESFYNTDYFVVECVNWQSICVSRKLLTKYIEIDTRYDNRLLNGDDLAQQFMMNNVFNIVFPSLAVYHDSGELKKQINLKISNTYNRSENSHQVYKDRWGWEWGYRNKELRQQFNAAFPKYMNTIQSKLFQMHVSDGPKKVEDFE